MKVAHVITRMIIGGAQENTLYNCLDLANDFQDEVVLITGPTDGPEGRLLERLTPAQRQAISIKIIPTMQRSIHLLKDRTTYRDLRKFFSDFKPDVVHTHSAKAGILGRLAAWQNQVPVVIHSVHGAPFYPYQNRIEYWAYRWCEWYAAKRCHHLVSVADAMTQLMVDANVAAAAKFSTIYSGMEVQPFLEGHLQRASVRKELGIAADDIIIGKIARLAPLKGHEYLLQAAKGIIAQNPKVKFLLIGDGSLTDSIKATITQMNLSDHFIFTGLVDPQQVPRMIAAMDIVVHTSLREGLARVLPQALISGLPVVSFDIDGAREVCISGETGWLIPAKNTEQLQQKLLSLSNSPEDRQRMGRAGQCRFSRQFDHQFMTQQIRELYQQLRSEAGATTPQPT